VAKFIKNDKLAIGTASNGVYILTLMITLYKYQYNVLMNNPVLSIAVDKENDLWFGLDNGIAHLEVQFSISIFMIDLVF
jgi:ligand-binding sensor domain-containing protein